MIVKTKLSLMTDEQIKSSLYNNQIKIDEIRKKLGVNSKDKTLTELKASNNSLLDELNLRMNSKRLIDESEKEKELSIIS